MGIKVSIVLPVYNVEKYLRQCLDSIFVQTLDEIEVVAVNDGSTDGSLAVLEEYEKKYSEHFVCVDCGINFEELTPRMFSFNAPQGACPECNGIGSKMEIDPDLIVPDKTLTLNEGAIAPWSKSSKRENYYYQMLEAVSKHFNFSMDVPFDELDKELSRASEMYRNQFLIPQSDK